MPTSNPKFSFPILMLKTGRLRMLDITRFWSLQCILPPLSVQIGMLLLVQVSHGHG